MKSTITASLLFYFLIAPAIAQPASDQQQDIQGAVRIYFDAFSEMSFEKLEQVVTPDHTLLEQGEVWNLDSLRAYFKKPRPADFKRVNHLDFFETEADSNMAYVSYHNTADIHVNGKDFKITWLESAVLVKDRDRWRIKMLHSTRVGK